MKYKLHGIVPDDITKMSSGRDYTRNLVRQRDARTCQRCFKKWRKGMRQFDVHHLQGLCGMKSKGIDKVTQLNTLITLCHRCHMNEEIVKKKLVLKTGNFKLSPQAHTHPFYH